MSMSCRNSLQTEKLFVLTQINFQQSNFMTFGKEHKSWRKSILTGLHGERYGTNLKSTISFYRKRWRIVFHFTKRTAPAFDLDHNQYCITVWLCLALMCWKDLRRYNMHSSLHHSSWNLNIIWISMHFKMSLTSERSICKLKISTQTIFSLSWQ